ncbi:MAG: hypothetical protein KGJ79_16025 [Alphaproteobacteria bacterium]|nr:hypothetical protein [Alphaproteobacteria bacterium]MDE2493563.1 hypothetical protein [Alphaproteobacteria bacterium]
MLPFSFPALDVLALSGTFILFGLVQFVTPGVVRNSYCNPDFSPSFCRVSAVMELLAGTFLAMPVTRSWGLILAAFITFSLVVMLLGHSKYLYALPVMIILVALVPAALTLHI